jgi:hypothetical protein
MFLKINQGIKSNYSDVLKFKDKLSKHKNNIIDILKNKYNIQGNNFG